MNYDFSGKVVLVTGSSSGIGQDAAITLASLGAQVVVTGRDSERLAAVALQCNQVSPTKLEALEIVANVVKDADVREIIDKLIAKFGKLDVLVNNAGAAGRAEITSNLIVDTLDAVYKLNVRALVLMSHLAAPHLIASKGTIINISSVASTMPGVGGIPYSCSKAAVDMATRVMALELTPKGVRVNAINPGLIDTPFAVNAGIPRDTFEQYKTMVEQIYPARRVGKVADTSAAIVFLASDHSSFISGSCLPVEGGYLCTTATTAFASKIAQKK